MKIAVRYYTRSGNTKKLADAIADAVGVQAQEVSVPLDEITDVLFLGSSVYAGGVDDAVRAFVKDNAAHIGLIVNFSTAALAPSTYKQVKKLAEENKIEISTEEFHCRGSFAFMHRSHPDNKDMKKASEFARKVISQCGK